MIAAIIYSAVVYKMYITYDLVQKGKFLKNNHKHKIYKFFN